MAKRMSPFADDFRQITKTAESVVQFVRDQEDDRKGQASNPAQHSIQPTAKMPSNSDSGEAAKQSGRVTKKRRPKDSNGTQLKKSKEQPKTWGKPVATLNTRIPEQMSELLDDLIYRLRKQGTTKTKQDLAREAIQDLLRKHSMC
ncbi:MAG: hypothetical protein AAGG48_26600 [Planctomycetota bacterium]